MDLSKAFDSVSHDILLRKCNQIGIDKFWFEDYLKGRVQSVRIGSVVSSPRPIKFGVPQGSILGPILLLIYINDMSNVLCKYFLVQYADDTQLILSGAISKLGSLIQEGEEALKEAKEYFRRNGLAVNEKKTQCIIIGSRQMISLIHDNVKINFGESTITPALSVKNLGVYMDRYILYDIHITNICRKANGILLYLNRIQDHLDRDTRTVIVQSLALRMINYCSRVWGMPTNEQLDCVQKC